MDEHDAELTALAHGLMPFTAELGLAVIACSAERVAARADWSEARTTGGGVMHGGYLMAVADSVGAACAGFNLPQGASTTTIESKTNFFRAVTGGAIRIEATPLHVGRSTIVVQTDITRDDGKLVSRTTQTQAVRAG
jgi:uncharacterized protein (TIGR00369 family)